CREGPALKFRPAPPYRVSAPLGSSRRSPSIVVMTLAASSSSVSSASSSASSLASILRICSAIPRMLGVEGKSPCVMALDPPLAPIHLGPCLLAMVASAQTLQVVAAVVVAVAVYVIDVLSRVGLAGPLAHQTQRLLHQDLLPDLLPPLAARVQAARALPVVPLHGVAASVGSGRPAAPSCACRSGRSLARPLGNLCLQRLVLHGQGDHCVLQRLDTCQRLTPSRTQVCGHPLTHRPLRIGLGLLCRDVLASDGGSVSLGHCCSPNTTYFPTVAPASFMT